MLFHPIRDGKNVDQFQGMYAFLSTERRTLFLYGNIGPYGQNYPGRSDVFSAVNVTDSILALNAISETEPIKLIIDSEGGDVRDGLVLRDTMMASRAPVYTFGRMAYSMAAILLSSGAPGHRYVYEHSHLMLHLPFGQYQGDPKETRAWANEMEKVKDRLVDILIQGGVKKTRDEILVDIDRQFWLTGKEIIDYGIADRIIQPGDL